MYTPSTASPHILAGEAGAMVALCAYHEDWGHGKIRRPAGKGGRSPARITKIGVLLVSARLFCVREHFLSAFAPIGSLLSEWRYE